RSLLTSSAKPVGLGAVWQLWTCTGEQSLSLTHIATTESVSLCTRMKSCQHFLNLRGSSTNGRCQRFLVMTIIEIRRHRWAGKLLTRQALSVTQSITCGSVFK